MEVFFEKRTKEYEINKKMPQSMHQKKFFKHETWI